MTRLYLPQPLAVGQTLALPDTAFRHLVQVLRMVKGEVFTVFNGLGGEYQAALTQLERRSAECHIASHNPISREAPLHITIAQCISKGDRMDYALQKATELGASAFVPLLSARGVVKLDDERWEKKQAHWQGVVTGAAEQSGRTIVPQVAAPLALADFFSAPQSGCKLILAPGGNTRLSQLPATGAYTVLVGPEGGFADPELQLAAQAGFTALALGPRILRTETAPVAILAALLAKAGDFG